MSESAVRGDRDATMSVAEANQRFYRANAAEYEASEPCLNDARLRIKMTALLHHARDAVSVERPAVLDACGGTGNVSTELVGRGIRPVVVDVSSEMTAIWAEKAQTLGFVDPEIHVEPIDAFLRRDEREWDLVTFSSALHHLENYLEVLDLVRRRLARGGVLVTIFDPTIATPFLRRVRRADYAVWLLFHQPMAFVHAIGRVVGRDTGLRRREDDYVGRLAERYAIEGIDDLAIVSSFPSAEFEVLRHERSYEARLRPIRWLLRRRSMPTSFSLLIRRLH